MSNGPYNSYAYIFRQICVSNRLSNFRWLIVKKQVDGSGKNKKGRSGFQVGKRKVKTKLTALAKAKAEQAMEVDK